MNPTPAPRATGDHPAPRVSEDDPAPRVSEDHAWRFGRRRAADGLRAALAPIAACSVALGGLTTWVSTGNAGSPARIEVGDGRVLLPYGDVRDTAAFFRITNAGGADDRLLKVTSSAVEGSTQLSRHRMINETAAAAKAVDSVRVPARGVVTMSPFGLDVTMRSGQGWQEGTYVPFTLYFERSGRIDVQARVVRPGGGA